LKHVAVNVLGAEQASEQEYPSVPKTVRSVRTEVASELSFAGTANEVAPLAPKGSSDTDCCPLGEAAKTTEDIPQPPSPAYSPEAGFGLMLRHPPATGTVLLGGVAVGAA